MDPDRLPCALRPEQVHAPGDGLPGEVTHVVLPADATSLPLRGYFGVARRLCMHRACIGWHLHGTHAAARGPCPAHALHPRYACAASRCYACAASALQAGGLWLVEPAWVYRSLEAGRWLEEEGYEVQLPSNLAT